MPAHRSKARDLSIEFKHAANHAAWALGAQRRNGFHVRRVVWGLEMARAEKREGEEIRRVQIMVKAKRAGKGAEHAAKVERIW